MTAASAPAGGLPANRLSMNASLAIGLGLACLYGPTVLDLFQTVWATDAQGHGPIVLAVAGWLFYRNWPREPLADTPNPVMGWPLVAGSLAFYALGRSQSLMIFEAGSSVFMLTGLLLLLKGHAHLRAIWFPLFFLCFAVPLPPQIVDTLTQPMKLAVSYVAETVLVTFGLPVARSGVILQVGPYQLLVADACAGLQTLFTLEAMGLLYLNVVQHSSMLRNVALAILIVPISFIANVIRVIALILITYFFGDEAGQGFLHGFAGMVLFMSSLLLIITADTALRRWVASRSPDTATTAP
jgi:exosortase B